MIYTTLNRIRAHGPCRAGWETLLRHLDKTRANDEPLPLLTVLESNGVDDALWCLRAEPQHAAIWRLLAVRYARSVQHMTTDPRNLAALDVAERHAHGNASNQELAAARAAARDAAWDAAWAAAWAAARVAALGQKADDLRIVLTHYDAKPPGFVDQRHVPAADQDDG